MKDSAPGPASGPVLQGALCATLPRDCLDALPSETHLLLLREAALEGWPLGAEEDSPGLLEGQPAWRRELPAEAAAAADLPLVPGGYVAPRPPFFTPLPDALQARQLALGHEHAVLRSAAGTVFSWGGGRHGQLGHGELESGPEPRLVEALHGILVVAVSAGGWHSTAVSETGDLYVWGWNESGQLALPSKAVAESQAAAPVDVSSGEVPQAQRPSLEAEAEDVELQVGQQQVVEDRVGGEAGFISVQALPALLDMPHGAEVSRASCGSRHTAAVTSTGELYTWGWGKYGQLGHGDTVSSDQPRRVRYFAERGLRVADVVCGPWSTYIHAVEQQHREDGGRLERKPLLRDGPR
ncbi:RCC1 domain-containing protein 1 [Varanus komodoensis]|uniref:RCC1 domain-containing protein 1 n=1 Tax=Varanus komodoensis TaxID=61221 RepID=UPI001CF79BE4|nr:RCC1 domain-containing protein 1 [Varanus komodoensis]